MSRTNETRHKKWHETCKWKCSLVASVCNNKQKWNNDKCMCECKELVDIDVCDKGFTWNPSNSECERDKSCGMGEYSDYENWKCRKKLVDKLVEECTENIDEAKIAEITLFKHKNVCKSSWTLYIVLFSIIFTINIGIATYFVYYKYINHNRKSVSRYDYVYQATNYQYKWEISKKLTSKVERVTFLMIWLILKDFDLSLLKIDKKSYKNIGI